MTAPFVPTEPLAAGVTLLEASAGTGKTHAIGSIVVRLVAVEGVGIERILAVTFTDAATAELRDRVRRRLRDARAALVRAMVDPSFAPADDGLLPAVVAEGRAAGTLPAMVARLTTALERFGEAPILTIHGWCRRLLRDHAFECGAELDAELLEDEAALLDELVRDWWSGTAGALDASLLAAVGDALDGGRLRAVARKAARGELVLLPEEAPEPAGLEAATGARRGAVEAFAAEWRRLRGELPALVADWLARKWASGTRWKPGIDGQLAAVDAWLAAPDGALPGALACFERGGLNKAGVAELSGEPLFVAGDALRAADAALGEAVAMHAAVLERRFAGWVREEFAARKRARRLRTFDDLLLEVRDALRDAARGPALAAAVREAYAVALIDEFQDTDGVQWETFRTVFGGAGARLALIGDPKQSIYAFRGADVHAYLAAREVAGTRRALAVNRRSDRPLVLAVSHLYARPHLPFGIAEIGYEDVGAHHEAARLHGLPGAPLRVLFLDRTHPEPYAGDKGTRPIDKQHAHGRAARATAREVAAALAAGATIEEDGVRRPLAARDCAVLVRDRFQASQVLAALRERGVAAVRRTDESVFESREAAELARVLAAVLDPVDGRRVRAALATDLLGVAAAREAERDRGLGEGTLGPGDVLALLGDDDARAERWTERLAEWRQRWERRGLMPAFRAMLVALALPERLLALPDGERRVTNLLHLAELLHAAATEQRLTPAATLAWLQREREEGTLDAEARRVRLESDEDAVQVATLHGSKGLEYPLVWLPWPWDGRLARAGDKALPVVREVVDGVARQALDLAPGAKERHERALDEASFREELRLLYVALTRARHRCTLVWGACRDAGTSSLAHLLYGEGEDPATAMEVTATRVETLSRQGDDALLAPLLASAADAHGFVEVVRVADDVGAAEPPAAPPRHAGADVEARRWARAVPLDARWRVGSFTWMTRARAEQPEDVPEAAGDARPTPALAVGAASAYDAAPAQLVGFPASADAGICLHWILEHADFADHAGLPAVVARGLARSGFDALRWRDPVAAAVRAVCRTPLAGDGDARWCLADVAPASRVSELAFLLPVRGGLLARQGGDFGRAALAAAFRDHPGGAVPADYADALAALRFSDWHGFLTGTMDLVVRHDGRWWVADWKSNHLGPALADYAPARLADEMTAHHYVLQYHLYLVALDRWLRARVPGYDYERDMGGARYLFLRGMPPGGDGRAGVFADRPPHARIRAIADALGLAPLQAPAVPA